MLTAPHCKVGWIVGTGPGWKDGCGEGRTHVARLVEKQLAADELELLVDRA